MSDAEPDPIEQIFQVFLGAATSLFVELGFLLVRSVLDVVLIVVFVAGALLAARLRSRFWGVGLMLGSAVPVILVLAFVPHDRREHITNASTSVVAPTAPVQTTS